MISATQAKADTEGLRNVRTCLRDFVTEGTGLLPSSVDYAMLFNILRADRPAILLEEAFRALRPRGLLAVTKCNSHLTYSNL